MQMLGPPALRAGETGGSRIELVIVQHGVTLEGWPWG